MKDDDSLFGVVSIAALYVLVISFGPILLIWSMNTLFGLSIVPGISQYFAAFVLIALFCRK